MNWKIALLISSIIGATIVSGTVSDSFTDANLVSAFVNATQDTVAGTIVISAGKNPAYIYSENLLEDLNATLVVYFDCDVTIPSGAIAKVSFSQDNSTWVDSGGISDNNTLTTGSNSLILTGLDWAGNFYYRLQIDNGTATSPTINSIEVGYEQLPRGGGWNIIIVFIVFLGMFVIVMLRRG